MTSSWNRYYSINDMGGSSFEAEYGNGKGGVGRRTAHIYYQKLYCWLDGGDFVSYPSKDCTAMNN